MKFRSTRSPHVTVGIDQAVLHGLAPDGGLYMPAVLPNVFSAIAKLKNAPFHEVASTVAYPFLLESMTERECRELCKDAFDFPVPLAALEPKSYVLELFHGPTLAFKDFGARFMARCMSRFLQGREANEKRTVLLVATSGDTGGAVAQGFYGVNGIDVVVLYPSGKVSPLQEKQFTTLGGNIRALEIKGTFDDCQRIVKALFADPGIASTFNLASANSINIARLIPQSFYYFWAALQLGMPQDLVFVTPSGNFGNLTAGILAERMGLPVKRFIAATNANDTVPRYLEGEDFSPKPSAETLSNAMDVGNPSNFERLMDLFNHDRGLIRGRISGVRCSDQETQAQMRATLKDHGYLADPHTAVGIFAERKARAEGSDETFVVLGTAHPAKFFEVVEQTVGTRPEIPDALQKALPLAKKSVVMEPLTQQVKEFLLESFR